MSSPKYLVEIVRKFSWDKRHNCSKVEFPHTEVIFEKIIKDRRVDYDDIEIATYVIKPR